MTDTSLATIDTMHPKATQEQFKRAQAIHESLIALKAEIEAKFLQLGKVLHLIDRAKIYKYLGYETFSAYIAQPELAMSRATAYRCMGAYETFVEKGILSDTEVTAIGITKVSMISRFWDDDVKMTDDERQDWIAAARTNSVGDLKKLIRRHGRDTDDEGEQRIAAYEEFAERLDTLTRRLPDTHDVNQWCQDLHGLETEVREFHQQDTRPVVDVGPAAFGYAPDGSPVIEVHDHTNGYGKDREHDAPLADDPAISE
jgi:hypothetical protein